MNTDYLTFAKDLARQAGVIMKANFVLGMKKEWKADHTPVTETDMAIHQLVDAAIRKEFPGHGILSEEGESHQADAEYVWVCDPLDGTHNFAHGLPTATFMLSLLQDGAPVIAVIYDPFMDRLFTTEKGKGAYMNDTRISVSTDSTSNRTLLGIGKWNGVVNLFPVAEALRDQGTRLVAGLSIGYMGALVAAGEFSAALFGGKDPHDMAAIKLLVEEAGGTVTDMFGKTNEHQNLLMQGMLATNGMVHAEILQIITDHGTKNK